MQLQGDRLKGFKKRSAALRSHTCFLVPAANRYNHKNRILGVLQRDVTRTKYLSKIGTERWQQQTKEARAMKGEPVRPTPLFSPNLCTHLTAISFAPMTIRLVELNGPQSCSQHSKSGIRSGIPATINMTRRRPHPKSCQDRVGRS